MLYRFEIYAARLVRRIVPRFSRFQISFKSGLRQTETAQSNKSWLKAPTDFARSTCRGNAERLGGKLQLFYTMGEYDLARILEMPDDEAEMQFALETGSLGNVRTKTLTQ